MLAPPDPVTRWLAPQQRERHFERLASELFDLVVIGGGAYGATLAYAGARAGLDVALVERDDFGNGTSANSMCIVHGGLRYLQQLDFARMRQSIRARRRLLSLAPHLVEPLRCAIGLNGRGARHRVPSTLALALNDMIAHDANRGVHPERQLGRSTVVSRNALEALAPGAFDASIKAGAVWWDGFIRDSRRLVMEFLVSAMENGAAVLNHAQAQSLIVEHGVLKGVRAHDQLSDEVFTIRCRAAVDASGSAAHGLLEPHVHGKPRWAPHWVGAANMGIDAQPFPDCALGLSGVEGANGAETGAAREYFFVPVEAGTLIGTSYVDVDQAAGRDGTETAVVDAEARLMPQLIDESRRVLPQLALNACDIRYSHFGLLPADPPDGRRSPSQRVWRHEKIVNGRQCVGISGFFCVLGVKWTTALEVADKIVDLVRVELGSNAGARHVENALPGARGLSMPAHGEAHSRYGALVHQLQSVAPALEDHHTIGQELAAEIVYAARFELAAKAEDLIGRCLSAAGRDFDAAALAEIVSVFGNELRWAPARRAEELRALRQRLRSTPMQA